MSLVVIVQARFGSSRLPGKTLEPLGEKSALARVLDRCRLIPGAQDVVCAIPDTARDDVVAQEAERAGYRTVRGDEQDVLARYVKAARASEAETVMRITSDCPFIDPGVCGQLIALFRESGADYASNSMPARYPHGLDCEVMRAVRLYEADRLASDPDDREHVTPWLRRAPHIRRAALVGPGQGLEKMRWTLDHAADLSFFQAVYAEMGEAAATASAAEIAALCLRRQDLIAINAAHIVDRRRAHDRRARVESAPTALPEPRRKGGARLGRGAA